MADPAIAAARRLADQRPEGEVPCPHCGNAMPGSSLAEHLSAKHSKETALPTHWEGQDHASQSLALGLGVLAVALVALGTALGPGPLRDVVAGVGALLLFVALGLALASFAGKLPGALALEGDVLLLTTFFGRRTRRLRLPPRTIEVGVLRTRVRSAVGGTGHHERRLGNYLRLSGEGSTLILGARSGTRMAKRWDPGRFAHGPKRQHWHLSLDRRALVQLEYQLAARGAF